MPAALAPQYNANVPYAYGPHSTAQRGRQLRSDYRMPRDASSNAASNPASNWYPRSSQIIPNSVERPVRINDTLSQTVLISFLPFTRRTGRQSNARMHRHLGCPASNFLIQALLITRPSQRLPLSLPTILQLASRGHLRILLPDRTYRSLQPDIMLRTLRHLI